MADQKISELTSIGESGVSIDYLPIVDVSATETKRIQISGLIYSGITQAVKVTSGVSIDMVPILDLSGTTLRKISLARLMYSGVTESIKANSGVSIDLIPMLDQSGTTSLKKINLSVLMRSGVTQAIKANSGVSIDMFPMYDLSSGTTTLKKISLANLLFSGVTQAIKANSGVGIDQLPMLDHSSGTTILKKISLAKLLLSGVTQATKANSGVSIDMIPLLDLSSGTTTMKKISVKNLDGIYASSARNPKAMAQGIAMTAAASGSNGIQAADNDNIDFGTGNFALVWKGSLPDWTPSNIQRLIIKRQSDGVFWSFEVQTSGLLRVDIFDGVGSVREDSSVATGLVDGTVAELVACIVRETSTTAGSVTFYLNGTLLGSSQEISASATAPTASNTGEVFINGWSTTRYAGTVHHACTLNFAPTAAEVLDMYRNGIPESWKWGSQTAVGSWTTFSSWNATATKNGTITFDASGEYAYVTVYTSGAVSGRSHLLQYEVISNNLVGGANFIAKGGTDNKIHLSDITLAQTVGVHTIQLPGNTQGLYNVFMFQLIGTVSSGSIVIDNVYIFKQGATLALEGEGMQPAPGQCLDSSSNKNHGLQPATGSSLVRPKRDFEVRWTNTWAGTHEAQYVGGVNQAVLPVGCYNTSIIGVVSGVTIEDIILGDGSDTDRWVTITTGLATGTTAFTIANPISDATNYKLVVDPDANFTGSIAWTIRGIILQ